MKTQVTTRRKVIAIILSASMIVLLTFGGIFAVLQFQKTSVSASVEMDVNPSLKINLSGDNRVIEVLPLNADAEKILGTMDLRDTDLEVATNALIGALLKNGYLSTQTNTVLLSVDSNDPQQADTLRTELTADIQALLKASSIDGAVLCQNMSEDQALLKKASDQNIPEGKAQFIQKIIEKYPQFSFDELASMSIHDLALILYQSHDKSDKVDMVGQVSEQGLISEDQAKDLALKAAQADSALTDIQKIELTYYHSSLAYEVTFTFNGQIYQYKLDAKTGQILEQEVNSLSSKDGTAPSESTSSSTTTGNIESSGYISLDQVKSIALADAGLAPSDATFTKTQLNKEDNGSGIYELKFLGPNGKEYEYKIDAVTGSILERSHSGDSSDSSSNDKSSESSEDHSSDDGNKDHNGDKNTDGSSDVTAKESEDRETKETSEPKETKEPRETREPRETTEARETKESESTKGTTAAPSYIGEGQAKAIALGAAGVAESNVSEMQIELETGSGSAYYKIEFKSADHEYKYKIDAVSGSIIG